MGRPPLDDEDAELPPSPRRLAAMRARFRARDDLKPCGCGACGLSFPRMQGRKYHPDCPSRSDAPEALRSRRVVLTRQRPRCEMCFDQPHRREEPTCPVCDGAYAAETLAAVDASTGCALGSVL
jgi:hypothetical protein